MRRFGFAIEFDEPEACATLRRHFRDMPPEVVYSVTVGSRRRDYMQIQASRLDFEEELKSTWAVFSDHIEKRNVQDRYGDVVGKDNWGYWKGGKDRRGNWVPGKRWRYIRFDRGTVVGYLPTTDENAQMFDVIISSACYPGKALP